MIYSLVCYVIHEFAIKPPRVATIVQSTTPTTFIFINFFPSTCLQKTLHSWTFYEIKNHIASTLYVYITAVIILLICQHSSDGTSIIMFVSAVGLRKTKQQHPFALACLLRSKMYMLFLLGFLAVYFNFEIPQLIFSVKIFFENNNCFVI